MKRYVFNFGDDGMKNQSGFTLIELIMVIVIIGLVAAVAVAKLVDLSDSAKASECKTNQAAAEAAASLSYAVSAFEGPKVEFPGGLDDLMFRSGKIPTCPFDKNRDNIAYDKFTGSASCPYNVPEHARF